MNNKMQTGKTSSGFSRTMQVLALAGATLPAIAAAETHEISLSHATLPGIEIVDKNVNEVKAADRASPATGIDRSDLLITALFGGVLVARNAWIHKVKKMLSSYPEQPSGSPVC